MGNGRNGIDPAAVPQGIVGPIMPMAALDVSRMPLAPIEVQRHGHVPISKLTSALASASPNDRTMVSNHVLLALVGQFFL